jgi:hypothetical protein
MLARLSSKMRHVAARVTDLEDELAAAVEAEEVSLTVCKLSILWKRSEWVSFVFGPSYQTRL